MMLIYKKIGRLGSVTFVVLCLGAPASAAVWYVDASALPGGDGTTWAQAFDDPQCALDVAQSGDEIWVAAGTYNPSVETTVGDPRSVTFVLIDGVGIYGGFAGTETDRSQRDWVTNLSILSCDLLGNDEGSLINPTRDENCYHVLFSDQSISTTIDGLTVSDSDARDDPDNISGGGLLLDTASATIRHCTFERNAAHSGGGVFVNLGELFAEDCTFFFNKAFGSQTRAQGGGIYSRYSTSTVSDCVFLDNSSLHDGGGITLDHESASIVNCDFVDNGGGGGIFADSMNNQTTISNCQFIDNFGADGGGLTVRGGAPTVQDCLFSGNSGNGGAIRTEVANLTVEDCTLIANIGGTGGIEIGAGTVALTKCKLIGNTGVSGFGAGGVFCSGTATLSLTNCLFSGNSAPRAGAIYYRTSFLTVFDCTISENIALQTKAGFSSGGVYNDLVGSLEISNSVLWGNKVGEVEDEDSQICLNPVIIPTVNYSCIQGWTGLLGGVGNIGSDPEFANAAGADGQAGTLDDNLRIRFTSPCIDAGDNTAVPPGITTDLDGTPRRIDDPLTPDTGNGVAPIVDMGAYEFPPGRAGDCNEDGRVNLVDFATFSNCFGLSGPNASCDLTAFECSDIDGNDIVNLVDFATFAVNFTS